MDTAYSCHIEEIVQAIFSTMLGMSVTRDQTAAEIPGTLLATIQISGPTPLTLVLSISDEASREAAAAMLQMPPGDVTEADQNDVAAELVNMVGGNLKSLLPSPSVLTLPTVVAGHAIGLKVHGAEMIDEIGLQCEGGPFCIRVYAQASGSIDSPP